MLLVIVLVVLFRRPKSSGWDNLCDYEPTLESTFLRGSFFGCLGDLLLPFINIKDSRAILTAMIWTLAVESRGIMP